MFLLSGDINLSIRGESDSGLLSAINGICVLTLIDFCGQSLGCSQTFRPWSREVIGQAEASPAASLVLMLAEDSTDTSSPRYAKAEPPLTFSRRRAPWWSIG